MSGYIAHVMSTNRLLSPSLFGRWLYLCTDSFQPEPEVVIRLQRSTYGAICNKPAANSARQVLMQSLLFCMTYVRLGRRQRNAKRSRRNFLVVCSNVVACIVNARINDLDRLDRRYSGSTLSITSSSESVAHSYRGDRIITN